MTDYRQQKGREWWEVQLPFFETLGKHFGYLYANGHKEGSDEEPEYPFEIILPARESQSEVILKDRLERKLKEINPGISDNGIRQAVAALNLPQSMGLLEANEKLHGILSRWTTVDEYDVVKRQAVGKSVRYFDYENPENNEFLVVEEFTVKRPSPPNRRFDLVIFVNGIPLVVVECKRDDDDHGLEKAVKDLLTYQSAKDGVPRLFNTVHFTMATKGKQAAYGTVETPLKHYSTWKDAYPLSLEEVRDRLGHLPSEQEVMIAGMLAKTNLLDMLRTFTVFDRQGGRVVKKVARYQQYRAVARSLAKILDPRGKRAMKERGGTIWHTQGSGKSLTMLWLAIKLKRELKLNNPTILIVTDRVGLDRQITKTFRYCGFENPQHAFNIDELRRLVKGPQGQTIMTMIHKFSDVKDKREGSRHPVLNEGENLFILIDEAHRTEYGVMQAHLKKALPNACRIVFTGTPIPKTLREFGDYNDKYTMVASIEDGATVPILYESRLPELAVWGNQLQPMFEALTPELTPEQRRKLIQEETTSKKFGELPDRIAKIAFDMFEHYRKNFEPDGFKAQVVVYSQRAAKLYFEELSKYLPDRVAVLISDPQDKGSDLWELRGRFLNEDDLIDSFLYDPVEKLAIIIVVAKYITGFDAPVERVMYLDRPLKDHTLMQAIARVNRPLPEKAKAWGLIVDYWGVSSFLDKALKVFADDLNIDLLMEQRAGDQAYQDLKKQRADAFSFFPKGAGKKDIEPWLLAIEQEDVRTRFFEKYRAFYRAIDQLLPDPRALDFLEDFAWLRRLRQEAVAQYHEEQLDVSDCSEKIRRLIDEHVKAENIRVLLEPVEILSDSFLTEVKKLHSPRAKASRMEGAIDHEITARMPDNPVFYETLKDRLEKIIEDRRRNRIDDVKEFELLKRMREELKDGQKKAADALGVDSTQIPFFQALERETEKVEGEHQELRDGLKVLTGEVYGVLESFAVIDWQQKEDTKREMRREIEARLRMAGWPADRLDAATTTIMGLAHVRMKG